MKPAKLPTYQRPPWYVEPVQPATDLELVCEIAFDWAGEYGFSMPDHAREVWRAAARLAPHLEPKRD